MHAIIVMMIYYTAGSIFSPTITPAIISGFATVQACEAAAPKVVSDFTRHPYGPSGETETPVVKCFSYPAD